MNTTPMGQWKFDAKNEKGDQVGGDIEIMIKTSGLDRVAHGRCSRLLVIQLFAASLAGSANPSRVVHEIEALEGGHHSVLKPPIQNKYPPLKGLWHKHFLQEDLPSLAKNVDLALKKYGMPYFDQKIREAEEAGEERYMTTEDLMAVADDVVHGNLARRREAEAMTGEWLIFAKHEGQNYYLAIATHDVSTHQHIRQQIDQVCCVEFPFLKGILEA